MQLISRFYAKRLVRLSANTINASSQVSRFHYARTIKKALGSEPLSNIRSGDYYGVCDDI